MPHLTNEHTAKKIDTLLSGDQSAIEVLVKKARAIQQLGQKLKSSLDPSFKDHFILANINNDVATIITPSSAWATRLRYNIPVILAVLTNELQQKNIKTIRIKIAPAQTDNVASVTKARKISRETALLLQETANSFADEELRNTLLRIARHHVSEED